MTAPWQPMDTAPRDGTPIEARIPGERRPRIISWEILEGGDEYGDGWVCGWTIDPSDPDDDRHPRSWTDGICWARNADGRPSLQPKGWRRIEE